jgi:zinc/manganese transport system substrate-binding protein/manganese/iron transport system substrate-binding protein
LASATSSSALSARAAAAAAACSASSIACCVSSWVAWAWLAPWPSWSPSSPAPEIASTSRGLSSAVSAVGEIERALADANPPHAQAYRDHAAAYRAEIEALDRAVRECWARVPRQQRTLVTTHDALGYYARRYGLEVVGTVIPSLSTQGEASAGELAELAETIRRERVGVVFAESSVNSKVEQAIADEARAEVGRELWADTLGPEGSSGATYLESIASNTDAMVEGVSGGAISCELPAGDH